MRRWLDVLLRGLHLVTVITLGAALLGAPLGMEQQALGVLASGTALMVVEFWGRLDRFRCWSGISLLLKLVLVASMMMLPGLAHPLFWSIVVWSALFSHAPASFRHRCVAEGREKS